MLHKSNEGIDFELLAELSKLEFNECEKESLKKELEEFFLFINKVKDVDGQDLSEDYNCLKNNVFREDTINKDYSSEEMLSNAKTCSDGYITVPRVVEGSEND